MWVSRLLRCWMLCSQLGDDSSLQFGNRISHQVFYSAATEQRQDQKTTVGMGRASRGAGGVPCRTLGSASAWHGRHVGGKGTEGTYSSLHLAA